MGVMFPSASRALSSSQAVVQERHFKVTLRCRDPECRREHIHIETLQDEVDDAATIHDFFRSGVIERLQFECDLCGCPGAILDGVEYLPTPADLARGRGEG